MGLKSGEYGGRNKSQAPGFPTTRLVRREIVENNDVPFVEGRGELCLDILLEDISVHGAINDPGCG